MSRKNVLASAHTVVAGSLGANLTSPVTNVQFLDNILIQLNFTGTPTGVFDVQFSADHAQDSQGNVTVAGNWVALGLTDAVAVGAANQISIDMNEMPGPWMRVVYTRTSGTGALDMYVSAKSVGA